MPHLTEIPTILVHGEKDLQAIAKEASHYPKFRMHAPKLPIQYGTHHGKLFILCTYFFVVLSLITIDYSDKVRIAVSTANLLQIDYERKTQVCEQSVFL